MTMLKKFEPEVRERALRMLAEALPEHKNKTAAARHVSGLLGISAETLRTWARRVEIDQGDVAGASTDVVEENRMLRREVAELRKVMRCSRLRVYFSSRSSTGPRRDDPVHRQSRR